MQHRHASRMIVGLVLAVALVVGTVIPAAAQSRFVIGTAGIAGALYPMGVAMAETINRHSDRFMASAASSAASVANLRDLQ